MTFGQCQLLPLFLIFWSITVGLKGIDGQDDLHYETADLKAAEPLFNYESDLIDFINAPTRTDEIAVALFYEEGCQSSMQLVPTWKKVIYQLRKDQRTALFDRRLPLVASFSITSSNKHYLQKIPVTRVPSIIFLSKAGAHEEGSSESLVIVEYAGPKSSALEILNGLRHYFLRFHHSGFQVDRQPPPTPTLKFNALTVRVDEIEEMERIVTEFQDILFQRNNLPLDPVMSLAERDWARYMLDENSHPDLYHVVCQCRGSRGSRVDDEALNEAYSAFDAVAGVLSVRRDVVFCVHGKCLEEGLVTSYQVIENNWTLTPESSLDPKSVETTDLRTETSFFCQGILRPSLLWLDRQASAPIIFSPNNKLHAALFVDFHNPEVNEKMRQTVVEFRRECKSRRVHNVVCFIVPSTDVRFLLQFGIDMWTPIDQKLNSENQDPFPFIDVFPCLLVTDQRQGSGIDYRVLEHPFARNSIGSFMDSVISHERGSEAQTEEDFIETKKNGFGVHILAPSSLQSFIESKGCHSMIMFYSPSCGHCKRLKVIWNALGELLNYIGLDNKLKLGMFDLSKNDQNLVNVFSVPDLYLFFGADPIRYDTDEAGAINDSIDILEWWVDSSSEMEAVTAEELLGLLEGNKKE